MEINSRDRVNRALFQENLSKIKYEDLDSFTSLLKFAGLIVMYNFFRSRLYYISVICLAALYLAILFLHYSKIGFEDFNFYWDAALRVSNGLSPYKYHDILSYVNGPSLSIILSFFSKTNPHWIVLGWRSCVLFVTFYLALRFNRDSDNQNKSRNLPLILGLSFLSFPFRNNLANVQVVVFVMALIYIFIKACDSNKEWLGAACYLFAFELKPYLVLFLLLILVWKKKFIYLIKIFIEFVMLCIVYYFCFQKLNYLNWLDVIKFRSKGITSGSDQATLLASLNNVFGIPQNIAFYLAAFVSMIIILFSVKTIRNFSYLDAMFFTLSASPLLGSFAHEQDYFISTCVLIYFFLRSESRRASSLFFFLLAISLNWTNVSVLPGYISLFILLLLVNLSISYSAKIYQNIILITVGVLSLLLCTYLNKYSSINASFKWHNVLAYSYGLGVWLYIILIRPKKSEEKINVQ